ncbi:MAG: hypothetical protein WC455_00745 [Dehalococcoidia bacterium]
MGLDSAVQRLLIGGQHVEVHLRCRRHGLDKIFQWIFIDPTPQVQQQRRLLGVGEEQRVIAALLQVFQHGLVVGEVAVVHQGLVERAEGVAAAGVPDAAAGGVALVRQPGMGLEIVELIVTDDVLGVAHDLQYHHVPSVGHDEGLLLAQRGVVLLIDIEAVAVDELVLGIAPVERFELVLRDEFIEDVVLHTHEIAHHVRRPDIEADSAMVVERGQFLEFIDLEERLYEVVLDLTRHTAIQQGDVQHVVLVQDLPRHPEGLRYESDRADAAALAVAPVVHLHRGREDVLPGHGGGADEAGYAAAALLLRVGIEVRHIPTYIGS